MPYTAPLKPLLSAQHIEYSVPSSKAPSERPGLARSGSECLQNSRSYSSTSYARRHRRSLSTSQSTVHPSSESTPRAPLVIDPHASLRQSPPPVSDAAIPVGAVISPPESAPNSDEESPYGEGIKLEELEAAVRSIGQRRESSPEREKMGPTEEPGTESSPSSSSAITLKPDPKPNNLRLSNAARKIGHGRSSTETAIELRREEALTSSPDDSDEEMTNKPPMVRKKSGELVRPALRPASARRRPSSMPGTPVYSKAVHFDSQLEHIRHFLQLDRPLAVSANTSPVESHDGDHEFPFGREDQDTPSWEWELRLSNAPKDISSRSNLPVQLERVFLSADKKVLIGSVAVANLAFQKHVAARFTLDYWRTTSEVVAVYYHDVRRKQAPDGYDRFSFEIKLDDQANLEHKTMFICIRYTVNGQEFWDNNHGMNYQVDFVKSSEIASTKPSGGARPALPRSRTFATSHSHSHSHSSPRSMPPLDDFPDISKNVPFSNPFTSNKPAPLNRTTSSDDIDTVGPPKRRETQNRQGFSNRYDFGASLTAAMRAKTPLDRTTLTARARSEETPEAKSGAKAASSKASAGSHEARKEGLKPSSLVSSKPCLESSVYKELVDKYCFYGSPKSSDEKTPSVMNANGQEPKQLSSDAPSPPLSPRSPPATDASSESRQASTSPRVSPRTSPRMSPRSSPSPMPYRYPYHQAMQNGFMKDTQSSPVISG